MVLEGGPPIQAFPLTPTTFVGSLTDFNTKGYVILHCVEDGTLTLNFGTTTLSVDVQAGMDFSIDPQCQRISSTGKVMIS